MHALYLLEMLAVSSSYEIYITLVVIFAICIIMVKHFGLHLVVYCPTLLLLINYYCMFTVHIIS